MVEVSIRRRHRSKGFRSVSFKIMDLDCMGVMRMTFELLSRDSHWHAHLNAYFLMRQQISSGTLRLRGG